VQKYSIGSKSKETGKKEKKKPGTFGEDSPFGARVLANIPENVQMKLDSTLVTFTFVALGFVVLSGVFH